MIYFIQDGDDGPIKIGYSDDVARRVRDLSTSTHNKLQILLVISGEREQEDQLHERFGFAHKRGDWFWPVKDLLSFIDGYKLSTAELSTMAPAHLPPPQPIDERVICELRDKGFGLRDIYREVFGLKPSGKTKEKVKEILRKSGRLGGKGVVRRHIDEQKVCQLYDEGKSLHIICHEVLGQVAGGHQYRKIREVLRKSGRTK
jgi:hypothetical protein